MLSGVSTTTKSSSVPWGSAGTAALVEYTARTPTLPMQIGVMAEEDPFAPAWHNADQHGDLNSSTLMTVCRLVRPCLLAIKPLSAGRAGT